MRRTEGAAALTLL
ncbi:MAG: hypothetical protein QG550_190, partial [Pseudomonadota bacterium]|nr:hypothetical protein [Pseudomonadota bacterium]